MIEIQSSQRSIQKSIARNCAARVQIEYDVALYGAKKNARPPFVAGVLADFSGRSKEELTVSMRIVSRLPSAKAAV